MPWRSSPVLDLAIWLVIIAVAIFLAVGVGSCVLAMAQYG
jgi:hypothetical protein